MNERQMVIDEPGSFWHGATITDARPKKDELGYREVICDYCNATISSQEDRGVSITKSYLRGSYLVCIDCATEHSVKYFDKVYPEGSDLSFEKWY